MEKEIRNILIILNKSQCPLAGNGKDEWLSEILFKPSFERYRLMEWILDQLEINVSEIFQNETSVESKIQSLATVLSAIGICGDDEIDVIEGTASRKKQLTFWKFLCRLLSKRNYLEEDSNNSDSEKLSEYESSTEYIGQVCELVNLNDAFGKKLQLFPDHLTKEVKEFFKKSLDQDVQYIPECLSNDLKQFVQKSGGSPSAEEIRKNYFEKFGVSEFDNDVSDCANIQQKNIEIKEFEDKIIPEEALLQDTEDKTAESLKNLKNEAMTFENVHESLKPYLSNVELEDFVDIGPAFMATENKLNSFLKLKNSAASLKTSNLELKTLLSDVNGHQVSSGFLTDNKLDEYLEISSLRDTEQKFL